MASQAPGHTGAMSCKEQEALEGRELGADMQPVFGLRDRWESDLGSDLQAMGRECITSAKKVSGTTGLPALLLSLAEQHPRMSI